MRSVRTVASGRNHLIIIPSLLHHDLIARVVLTSGSSLFSALEGRLMGIPLRTHSLAFLLSCAYDVGLCSNLYYVYIRGIVVVLYNL